MPRFPYLGQTQKGELLSSLLLLLSLLSSRSKGCWRMPLLCLSPRLQTTQPLSGTPLSLPQASSHGLKSLSPFPSSLFLSKLVYSQGVLNPYIASVFFLLFTKSLNTPSCLEILSSLALLIYLAWGQEPTIKERLVSLSSRIQGVLNQRNWWKLMLEIKCKWNPKSKGWKQYTSLHSHARIFSVGCVVLLAFKCHSFSPASMKVIFLWSWDCDPVHLCHSVQWSLFPGNWV